MRRLGIKWVTTVSSLTGNLLKINCNAGFGMSRLGRLMVSDAWRHGLFAGSFNLPVGETASYALYSEQYTNLLN